MPPPARDGALDFFLRRLDPVLAGSFTDAQLAAIEHFLLQRFRARHALDWRKRLALPFCSLYVVLLAGVDPHRR